MRPGQTTRHVALMIVQIVVVAALFVFVQLIAEHYNRRFDVSPEQQFVLSEAAHKVAAELSAPLRITAFYNNQEVSQKRQILDVLGLFAEASPKITYRLVDLDRSPALAQRYGVSNSNTGVVETEAGKFEVLRTIDEEEISSGILKLTRPTTPTLCFLSGHGEHSPCDNDERRGYSEVGKALERENFEVRCLETVPTDGVPADCRVVVMAGPTTDLLPGEADQLGRFIDRRGQMLVLIDPGAPDSVIQFLLARGVRPGNDVVLDERNRLIGTDSSMLNVPTFNKKIFRQNLEPAVFPVSRTVLSTEAADEAGMVTVLALSSQDSWAYVGGDKLPDSDVRFRRDIDQPGPLPVAVMATPHPAKPGEANTPPGRMMVFGDSDFPDNLSLNWRGNKDLFMSSIAVLAEDPTLLATRRKGPPSGSISPIYLTEAQDSVVFWISVIVVPSIFAVVGIVLTARRRRRASR